MRQHRRTTTLLSLAALWFCAAPAFAAETIELDPQPLIDYLAREDMSELLDHLIASESGDDPIVASHMRIAKLRLEHQRISRQVLDARQAGDPQRAARLAERSLDVFERMLDEMRQLIEEHHDHEQRPIWQTDLAEALLIDYLQQIRQYGGDFHEFGVPSLRQRQTFAKVVPDALHHAQQADLRFFQFQALLPREPDHIARRVNTGLWMRMIDEYWKQRTQYYLAYAAHLAAMLDDEHEYFDDVSSNVQTERQRLHEMALERAKRAMNNAPVGSGLKRAARSLAGRALAHLRRTDDSIAMLDPVIGEAAGDVIELRSRLGAAEALSHDAIEPALRVIETAQRLGVTHDDPLLELLVTDAEHRLLLAEARRLPSEQRGQALRRAFEPYERLLADPKRADTADAWRDYIERRWATHFTIEELVHLPPEVQLSVARSLREQAAGALLSAERQEDRVALARAERQLEQSVQLNERLLEATDSPRVSATAGYNIALARYLLNRDDPTQLVPIAKTMVDLADEYADVPVAEQAIAVGADLLRQLHERVPRPAGADEGYRSAVAVLLDKFPATRPADDQLVYYAYEVLQSAGKYAQAIDLYQRVPVEHPSYWDAQRERLFAMCELAREAEDPDEQIEQLVSEIEQVLAQASDEAQSTRDVLRRQYARRAVAGARLVRADLAVRADDYQAALEELAAVVREFSEEQDLVLQALKRHIMVLIEAGKLEEAGEEARQMMQRYPDDAVGVIEQALLEIDREIQRLREQAAAEQYGTRQQQLEQQAMALAQTASQLADILLAWARQQQDFGPDELLPFELMQVRALRLSGQLTRAMQAIQPLAKEFGDDIEVVNEYAEILFARGMHQLNAGNKDAAQAALVAAAAQYDRLIEGLYDPYPPEYWNAWVRRLTINDKLDEYTEDIPLVVRQLELEYPDLGGAVYRRELKQLAEKHENRPTP